MMPTAMEINNHISNKLRRFLKESLQFFADVESLVGKNLPNQQNSDLKIYSKRCCQSFAFHKVTEDEVNERIKNIKNYSASGLNGITPKYKKLLKVVFASFLTKIFVKYTAKQIFLENLKLAAVISFHYEKCFTKNNKRFSPYIHPYYQHFLKYFEKITV